MPRHARLRNHQCNEVYKSLSDTRARQYDDYNMNIQLSNDQITVAVAIGVERNLEALTTGLADAESSDGLRLQIERAAGEMAVAKALNRYWLGGESDVGALQIRERWPDDYELIVRVADKNKDDDTILLVAGKIPCFTLRGWICGDGDIPTFAKQVPTSDHQQALELCAICRCSLPGIGRELFDSNGLRFICLRCGLDEVGSAGRISGS
jgi:hypothetical protein